MSLDLVALGRTSAVQNGLGFVAIGEPPVESPPRAAPSRPRRVFFLRSAEIRAFTLN
jgi:hypothetical protein